MPWQAQKWLPKCPKLFTAARRTEYDGLGAAGPRYQPPINLPACAFQFANNLKRPAWQLNHAAMFVLPYTKKFSILPSDERGPLHARAAACIAFAKEVFSMRRALMSFVCLSTTGLAGAWF